MNGFYKHWVFILTALSTSLHLRAQTDTSKVLEEVTVSTGQYTPQSVNNSVYKIQTISKEKIAAKAATNLTQILNTELGIGLSNDNTLGTTDISFMGVSGRNVKILIDGMPMLDRGDTRESINQIDVTQIERIEIVEGPMSTMYGTDALAGVINIITKKAAANSLNINAKIQEETAGNEYKPFKAKGLHTQNIGVTWDNNGWNALASLGHYDFKGFSADEYKRNHSWRPKEQWLPTVRLGYRKKGFNMYYRNDYLWERITTNAALNMDTYRAIDQFYNTRRMMHQLQNSWQIKNNSSLNNAISYTDYKRFTRTILKDYRNNTEQLTTGAGEQDTAKFNTLTWRTTFQHIASSKLSMQPGIEINHESAKGQRIEGEPEITDYALFVSAEYKPIKWLNIRPGLRFVKNSIYDAPPAIPSLNALINFTSALSFRASYAHGYRAPALRELYFDFQDANHAIFGNPNLEAEKSRSMNVSLVYNLKTQREYRYTLEAGGFYNHFDNLITIGTDPNDQLKNVYVNIDENKTAGASVKGRLNAQNWQAGVGGFLLGQYNRLSNNDAFSGQEIPRFNWTPELNADLMYTVARSKTSLNFFYRFNGRRKIYQTTDGVNVTLASRNAFHYGDFSIGQYINKFLTANAGIRNVFGITDVQSTQQSGGAHSTGGNFVFNYGRSYFLTLNLNYSNFKKQ